MSVPAAFSAVDTSVWCAALMQGEQHVTKAVNTSREIVLIDAGLPDMSLLLAGIPATAQVYLLDPSIDGIAQIQAAVGNHGSASIDALHVVCHGMPGELYLGGSVLNSAAIGGYATALAGIGSHLRNNADILLYSCFTGQGALGKQFVSTLAALTGGNVAASDSLVGSGEWSLAQQSGPISTQTFAWPAWPHTLGNATGTFTSGSPTKTFPNREGEYYVGEYVLGDVEDGTQVKIDHGWITKFFDAYLYIVDRNTGNVVAANDDALGANSQITITWQSHYVVVPTMYNDTTYAAGSLPAQWQMQARDPVTNNSVGSFALLDAEPDITSINYDFVTGELVVGGTNFVSATGDSNDIIASQFTFTGANGATYTLTDTPNVDITSLSFFTLTLSATDRAAVNVLLDQPGTSAIDGTLYSVTAAAGWAAGSPESSDLTGNNVVAANVPVVNQAPVFTSVDAVTVQEKQTEVITLTATDADSPTLTFSIHGGEDAALFTVDINTGVLSFIDAPDFEAATDANSDGVYLVELSVSDGDGESALKALSITVADVNEAPTLVVNSGTSVVAGAAVTLTSAMLLASDVDDTAAGIFYTVTALPGEGVLRLDANALIENDTFSQADVNAGRVSFQAGTSSGAQAFTFTLEDGGEDDAIPLTGEVFTFNVSSPPVSPPTSPAPSLPTGGVTVTAGGLQPNMPSGLLSVSEIIRNEGSSLGVVALVTNTGSTNLVTALLPVGVTLDHNGSRQAIGQGEAISDLLASIASKNPGNGGDHASVATQWLSSRSDGSLIDIRTLSFSGALLPDDVISLTGNTSTSSFDAFVIDLSNMPSGQQLQLNDIDFASILGAGEIRGGLGDNVVIGDNANQTIVLGEGDDIIYGGGGDDVIGSLGGDDRLFGGDGNDELFGGAGADLLHGGHDVDVASYTGNREEYNVTQSHGVITVSFKAVPSNVDTLVNIETLRFADGEESVSYSQELDWITGLYAQVLGRQGDVEGVQYWAQQYNEGLSRADLALLLINSLEAGGQSLSSSTEVNFILDTLYQVLLGRDADTAGAAYWADELSSGRILVQVVEGFLASDEMRTHDLSATQWDFIA